MALAAQGPTRFLSGYEETREVISLDLHILSKLMEKETHRIYRLNEDDVTSDRVEKRYQINLIVKETLREQAQIPQRWKLVMNRSSIIDIEAAG